MCSFIVISETDGMFSIVRVATDKYCTCGYRQVLYVWLQTIIVRVATYKYCTCGYRQVLYVWLQTSIVRVATDKYCTCGYRQVLYVWLQTSRNKSCPTNMIFATPESLVNPLHKHTCIDVFDVKVIQILTWGFLIV